MSLPCIPLSPNLKDEDEGVKVKWFNSPIALPLYFVVTSVGIVAIIERKPWKFPEAERILRIPKVVPGSEFVKPNTIIELLGTVFTTNYGIPPPQCHKVQVYHSHKLV
ncbi:hypothetical protein K1719_037885 [Acacia pycnantha]|nr:hypothetical protein K1719_037885 [Acacia pycnantha]